MCIYIEGDGLETIELEIRKLSVYRAYSMHVIPFLLGRMDMELSVSGRIVPEAVCTESNRSAVGLYHAA